LEFAASGVVVVVLPVEAPVVEELSAELMLLDGDPALLDACVPSLRMLFGVEPFEGFELFEAAVFDDVSGLSPEVPVFAPLLAAEGPELLLPAPQ